MEYEDEPIPGLPGRLPPGEDIIWQATPDWRGVARGVFHTRLVAAWFIIVAAFAFVAGGTGLKRAPRGALARGDEDAFGGWAVGGARDEALAEGR